MTLKTLRQLKKTAIVQQTKKAMKTILYIISFICVFNTNAQVTLNHYFGNIHSHTSYSDGNQDSITSLMTTPLQAFNYAKASQHIDFYGISEHNHASAGLSSAAKWHLGVNDANTANIDGSFVALYGQEWGVISSGGHVLIYGSDSLFGWDYKGYDVLVTQTDYASLWKKINRAPNSFAYLAHPNSTDYSNVLAAYDYLADSAIVGLAMKSGPAYSTNTNYSNPASGNYLNIYQTALKRGYHVGVGLDHDTHNSVFGRQSAGRLVVLAPSLTRANILDAFKKMRFYSSDDWNTKVNFTIAAQPLGSIIKRAGSPTLSASVIDADAGDNVASIKVYYGVPGSGTTATLLTTVNNTSTLNYTHNIANNSKYYYYLQITQTDGNTIYTSPIWYERNDAASNIPNANFAFSDPALCIGQTVTLLDASDNTPNTWAWSMPGGTPNTASTQLPTVTYNAPGTYTVTLTATNSFGSSVSYSKTINVYSYPTVTATSQTTCQGIITTITASGATSYSWNTGSSNNALNVTPAVTTTYTVTGKTNGCASVATCTVTVNPKPNVSSNSVITCSGDSVLITAIGANTYLWNNGVTTASQIVLPSTSTSYIVTGTDINGCSDTAISNVIIQTCVGLNPNTSTSYKTVLFPNPTDHSVTITSDTELGSISIYNTIGKLVQKAFSKNNSEQIDLTKLENGVYFVVIHNSYFKLIKT